MTYITPVRIPMTTTASAAADEYVPKPEEVEVVARALQRNDVPSHTEADAIWQDDYEPDGYKAAYRNAARAAIKALDEHRAAEAPNRKD